MPIESCIYDWDIWRQEHDCHFHHCNQQQVSYSAADEATDATMDDKLECLDVSSLQDIREAAVSLLLENDDDVMIVMCQHNFDDSQWCVGLYVTMYCVLTSTALSFPAAWSLLLLPLVQQQLLPALPPPPPLLLRLLLLPLLPLPPPPLFCTRQQPLLLTLIMTIMKMRSVMRRNMRWEF